MNPIENLGGTVLLVAMAGVIAMVVRLYVRVWRSRNWPRTEGTVQKGLVERNDSSDGPPTYSCLFQFIYTVNGTLYSGLFALNVSSEGEGLHLLPRVEGQRVAVSYNPREPQSAFVADEEVYGVRVSHAPQFVNLAPDLGQGAKLTELGLGKRPPENKAK